MLVKVLIVLAVIIIGFIVLVLTRPSEIRVTRGATLSAPALAVFAEVNDFHRWESWSPWEKLDPAMKRTFEGAPAGTGAIYSWVGNRNVGEGKMTIVDSRPGELIRIELAFLKPFKVTNMAEFTFKPQGHQTVVTWTMTGRNNFICKAMGLFMNMDRMIGGQFEQGLTQLKGVVEAASP